MATATCSSTSHLLSSASSLIDGKAPPLQSSAPQCVSLPTLPIHHNTAASRTWKATGYCRKIARNVVAMATGEAPAEVAELTTELPDLVKPLQEAWEKVEDKYAVASLGVAAFGALWVSAGMISAVDKLPLIPGVLELVGIGYTGWFAYKNLIFKPDREALIEKVKCTYKDIIGSS